MVTKVSPEGVRLNTNFLSPAVHFLVGRLLNLTRGKTTHSLVEFEQALLYNPVVNATCEIQIALTLAALGNYTNSNEQYQTEINTTIGSYSGLFHDDVASLMGFIPYGFSFAEVAFDVNDIDGSATLKGIRTVNQAASHFEQDASGQNIRWVKVYSGSEYKRTRYDLGIHLTNQQYMQLYPSPKGVPVMGRVMNYHDAYNILISALVIAGQRQATPILVGKTDTSSSTFLLDANGNQILGTDGRPILIYQGEQLRQSLEQTQNGSVLVVDRLDEVVSLVQATNADVILGSLDFLIGMMMLCFLQPRTIIYQSPNGVGDAGLSEQHSNLYRELIKRNVVKLSDALIEKFVKPQLLWNHGADVDDVGSFPITETKLDNAAELIGSISQAVATGSLRGSEESAADRIRELAGIA